MVEYWKWFGDEYKFYSEDKNILKQLKEITGARPHTRYYYKGELVAEDIIIPKKMFGRAKKISGKNLRYIE